MDSNSSFAAITKNFLVLLYGTDSPGWLVFWRKRDHYAHTIPAASFSDQIDEVLEHMGKDDLYFAVGLQDQKPILGRRGEANSVKGIPGFWMDIDIKGQGHVQEELPGSKNEVVEFLNSLKFPPTLVVSSGGGLHGYWLFEHPWIFNSGEEREKAMSLSKMFQADLIRLGKNNGWNFDNTSDLARLLRLPGTLNCKLEITRSVRIEKQNGPRFSLEEYSFMSKIARPFNREPHSVMKPDSVIIYEGHRNNALTSIAGALRRKGTSVDHIETMLLMENAARCVPPLPESEVKSIANSIGRYAPSENRISDNLPEIYLFQDGSGIRISDTAAALGELYHNKQRLFRRPGGYVQYLDIETQSLMILTPIRACSEFETVAIILIRKDGKNVQRILREADCKRLMESDAFVSQLPMIKLITKCPVIAIAAENETMIITQYDQDRGILASGKMPKAVDLEEAIRLLLMVIEEFAFQSSSDKSRCLASMITPALLMGEIGNIRSPIQLIEANESQSGKGYLTRIIAALYNDTPSIINQHRGGVGSFDEALSQYLISGRNFINIDNITTSRGEIFHSDKLCSLMTEGKIFARVPYKGGVEIDAGRQIIQLTTNGCTLSPDLMNRSCPIRIQKRRGYHFKEFPEGSILDHVKANSYIFQGAIFKVVEHWVSLGQPKTNVTVHESSFTSWAQKLDWIVQNILMQAPLLDGYHEIRARMESPRFKMLRDLALAIIASGKTEYWLRTQDLVQIAISSGVDLSPLGISKTDLQDEHEKNAARKLGMFLGTLFTNNDSYEIEQISIKRKVDKITYDYGTTKESKFYSFESASR